MTEKNAAAPGHIARLDVVRAAAFLAVYAFHCTGLFPQARTPWTNGLRDFSVWPREALIFLPSIYGWLGVTLFFVLSGFCIHYSTRRRAGPFAARDFFWRRFLRLYPAYFVALVLIGAVNPWLPIKYFTPWQFPPHLLLLHNLNKETFFGINPSFWSLAVEAQFYLLYPLLLAAAARWNLARCLAVSLVLNLIFYAWFGRTSDSANPVHVTWSFPLVTWCDWILGAALAEAYLEGRRLFAREKTWLVLSGLVLAAALEIKVLNVEGYLFGAVFFTVAMQMYLGAKRPLHAVERALIPVGLVSYSLYLWHEPLLLAVDLIGRRLHLFSTTPGQLVFDLIAATALLAPVGAAAYYFLEIKSPLLIRRLFSPAKAPSLPGIVREAKSARPANPR